MYKEKITGFVIFQNTMRGKNVPIIPRLNSVVGLFPALSRNDIFLVA